MSDERLRERERRYRATGSPDDEASWLAELARAGAVPAWLPHAANHPRHPLPVGVRYGEGAGDHVHERTGIVLVWVPPGTFRMGSDAEDAGSDEQPVHDVRLTRGCFVGKYEVTWGQYRAYCRAAGVAEPSAVTGQVSDQHPVG